VTPIAIQPRDAAELALWQATVELGRELQRESWSLIGAQMVFLLAYEHRLRIGRTSADIDLLVDVRAITDATAETSAVLLRLGYELTTPTPDSRGHRFRRGEAIVDVLAPDGIGSRASLVTIPPARTIRVPGGSQALRRTRRVLATLERETVELPCPSLVGGILLKARAVEVGEDPDKHRRDLAFLLSAVTDPRAEREDMKATERGWLRRRGELLDLSHPAWRGVKAAEDGRLALDVLSAPA